jgi:Flp pilus assembly protein TadD
MIDRRWPEWRRDGRLTMIKFVGAALLALVLGAGQGASQAWAAGSSDDSSGSSSSPSDYDKAVDLIEDENYLAAEPLLEKVVAKQPKNADAWNYLGFVQRNLGKLDEAFASYNEALLIDPEHDGANEYLGELYLMTGDLAKAEAQLEILDANCTFSCDEHDQLEAAIDDYKKKQGS